MTSAPAQTFPSPSPTSFEQAEAIVTELARRKAAWMQVDTPQRITYLKQCITDVFAVAQPWAEAACRAKGIDPTDSLAGEEWLIGPAPVISNLQQLIKTMQAKRQPKPQKLRRYQNQTIAQVFPDSLFERLLWPGFTGEVWIMPGQPATQGRRNRGQPKENNQGRVALVLGAGNVSSIAPMDALYQLFVEDSVVLLKMHPVNDYLGPFFQTAFQSLRQDGFFDVVYGEAELGSWLCQHPLIDTIHITGSHHTHDAIVWGSTPEEQAQRKASQQPLNPKPVTSELGCVTPVLVVPGSWSSSDLDYQARQVAGMVAHNASFNCAAAKVLVLAKGWPQREEFLRRLRQELRITPPRKAYYPGARQRYEAFLTHYPQADPVNSGSDSIIPWTLIPGVAAEADEYALSQEAFCGVLAEVSLAVTDAPAFLSAAVQFVNEKVWGNLSCTILIDPATQKQHAAALNQAIADLHYGAIAVNIWSALVYSTPACTWGAFPGNPLTEISSGQGVVHNTYCFDHPQKSVLRAPFRISPLPLWFSRRPHLLEIAQQYIPFLIRPGYRKLLKLVRATLKS